MTGLTGDAAVVGFAEWPSERKYGGPRSFQIEQWSQLAAEALADAGVDSTEVNGLVTSDLRESKDFVPATIAEYCGWEVNFERPGAKQGTDLAECSNVDIVSFTGPF